MIAQAKPDQPQKIKVVTLDSLQANKIINDLVSGDAAKAKVKILQNRVILRDTMIRRLKSQSIIKDEKIMLQELNLTRKDSIVSLRESQLKKETKKKSFWKWAFYGSLAVLGYISVK